MSAAIPNQRSSPDDNGGPVNENGQKLDRIGEAVTEVRVSMERLSGDLRASLARHDTHDRTALDVERRLRALERRSYAIPGFGAVLGLAGFLLALWTNLR